MDRIVICERCDSVFIGKICPVCGDLNRIALRIAIAAAYGIETVERNGEIIPVYQKKKNSGNG